MKGILQLSLYEGEHSEFKRRGEDKVFKYWKKAVEAYDLWWSTIMISPVQELKTLFDRCANHTVKQ